MATTISDPLEMAHLIMGWRDLSPLPNAYSTKKTTDPEARDYERAIGLFRDGLRAGRRGDLQTARSKIAAAYLLDYRCSRWFLPVIPPPEYDPEVQGCVLDMKFLMELTNVESSQTPEPPPNDPARMILQMFLAHRVGPPQENQALCAATFIYSQDIIDKIAEDPDRLEHNPNALEGQFSRVAIHHRRADLYVVHGNPKYAARELKRALQVDPRNYRIRAELAMISYWYGLKDFPTICQECNVVLQHIHPDNRRVRHLYAILAATILDLPALGTLGEAQSYYEKMKQSQNRQVELYGEREQQLQNTTKYCREADNCFAKLDKQSLQQRKWADGHMSRCEVFESQQKQDANEASIKTRHLCIFCRKRPADGVALRKCAKCKKVSYCSKECQRADWKYHKLSCEIYTEYEESK